MIGHHDVAEYAEAVTDSGPFQGFDEEIAEFSPLQMSQTPITGEGDEVCLLGFVVTLQTEGHEESLGS